MPRRFRPCRIGPRFVRGFLPALLLAMGTLSVPSFSPPAWPQERIPQHSVVLIRDAETETLLLGFEKSLFKAAGLDPGLIRIMLVRDRAINAFVSTGNRMFINTGLLQQAGSVAEVIGTMAHETGHVAHGDISRVPELTRQAMLQSLGSMLIGAAVGVASRDPGVGMGAVLGGTSMAERNYLAFSRGQEEAADESGLRCLDSLGWPAAGLLALFDRLDQEDALITNRRDPYLITHPLTRDRMEFVRHHVEMTKGRDLRLPPTFETRFQMVKAKLDGFLDPPAILAKVHKLDDPSPPARYAWAIAEHQLGHTARALEILHGLIRTQPDNPWLRELDGQFLFESGQARASIVPYQEAVRLAPDQPLIRQSLGHAMIEANDHGLMRQAVTQLQIAARQDRDDDATWHFLGIAWGRIGDMGEANLALAEESMLQNDLPAARRFARLAADTLPAGPVRLRAHDISNATKKENRP
jgi:predicted Zn-dependent protease